jgi:hypothetical protein
LAPADWDAAADVAPVEQVPAAVPVPVEDSIFR